MSHSLIVVSPLHRLQVVDGKHIELLGVLVGGDGGLGIPLGYASDPTTITHYTCHHGGTSPSVVELIEAIYAGTVPLEILPDGWTAQDVTDALAEVHVFIDGRQMGVDAAYPEVRLTKQAHMDFVLDTLGLVLWQDPDAVQP